MVKTNGSACWSTLVAVLLAAGSGCVEEEPLAAVVRVCPDEALNFGPVVVRERSDARITLFNCGSASISDLEITVDGPAPLGTLPTFFVPPAQLPIPVRPDQPFTLPVAFRPPSLGEHTATLVVTDPSDPDVPLGRIPLLGVGIADNACELTAAPVALDFSATDVASRQTAPVVLTHTGEAPCAITALAVVDGAGDFTTATVPPAALQPGETLTVTVDFSPRAAGPRTAILRTTVDGAAALDVPLGGTGVAVERCVLAGPSPVVFPQAVVNTTSTSARTVIENLGALPCTIATAVVDGDFRVDAGLAAGTTIAPGANATVDLTFTPAAPGNRAGTLTLTDATHGPFVVELAGLARAEPGCVLEPTPRTVVFTPIAVGLTDDVTVTLRNVGAIACPITGYSVDGVDFATSSSAPTQALAPGASTTVVVRYTPTTEAPAIGQLRALTPSVPGENGVALFGTSGRARFVFTPETTFFGGVIEGCASEFTTLSLTNVGSVAGLVESVALSADSDPVFTLQGAPITPTRLLAGQTLTLQARLIGDLRLDAHQGAAEARVVGDARGAVRANLFGESLSASLIDVDDRFQQTRVPRVDILFVIDNSGSMSEEQANLAVNFASLIAFTANLEIDYHIGIVTTDLGEKGRLVAPFIRNRGASPTPDPEASFRNAANVGINGSGDERGLQTAIAALTPPTIEQENAGFLREDALLHVVVISDEEDGSAGSVTAAVDQLLDVKGYRPELILLSSIAGDVPLGCATAVAGTRYAAATTALGGVFSSICDPDWAGAMEQIGLETFNALRRFELTREPDPTSIIVVITPADGSPPFAVVEDPINGWTLDEESGALIFNGTSLPGPGDVVDVSYSALCLVP